MENQEKGAFRYWHYVEMALQDNPPDLYLKFAGPLPILLMFTPKAIRELAKKVPNQIDRNDYLMDRYIGKMFIGSYSTAKSNERWKLRRDTSMKTLGLNFASRYIQLLVENISKGISNLEVGKEINFTSAFTEIEFDFTCKLLFGKDFEQKINGVQFNNADGTVEEIFMGEWIYRLLLDSYAGFTKTIGVIFPFLNDYNLIEPYKRIMKNVRAIHNKLKEFLKQSKDTESYYAKIRDTNQFTEDEIISDLMIMLFAGTDTTSHTAVSMMYYLGKYPEIRKKLRDDYEKAGIITKDGLQRNILTIPKLEEWDYAEYFIKETFRLDHTAAETVAYEAIENTEICGVPISKGTLMSINLFGPHYSKKEWKDPLKFIPERFDPESEYFLSPTTGKARDQLSFIPFSFGMRACPGQTMARLVQRVALPYFVANVEFDVNKEQLENEKILFNNYSQYHLQLTINRING